MKTLVIAATALAALGFSTAASAQDGTVTIDGTVAAKCVIAPSASITLGEMADTGGLYNNVADSKTAKLNAWCNGAASTMSVASTAISLIGGGAVPTGFTDTVNFTGTASVTTAAGAAVLASDSTLAAPSAAAAVSLFSDDITVTLSASSTDGGKLIAGTYQGAVVITLAPLA